LAIKLENLSKIDPSDFLPWSGFLMDAAYEPPYASLTHLSLIATKVAKWLARELGQFITQWSETLAATALGRPLRAPAGGIAGNSPRRFRNALGCATSAHE
jgi:hypothetical protein